MFGLMVTSSMEGRGQFIMNVKDITITFGENKVATIITDKGSKPRYRNE